MQFKKRSRQDLWQSQPLGSLKNEWPDKNRYEEQGIQKGLITWTIVCMVIWLIVALVYWWWFTPGIEQIFPGIKG